MDTTFANLSTPAEAEEEYSRLVADGWSAYEAAVLVYEESTFVDDRLEEGRAWTLRRLSSS